MGVFESKPSPSPKGNNWKVSTEKSNGCASNSKRYRGKKTWTKTQGLELKSDTDFGCPRSDL